MRYNIENRSKKSDTRLTRELVLGIVISIVQDMPTSVFLNRFSIKLSSMKRYARDLKMAKSKFSEFSFYNNDEKYGPHGKKIDSKCPLNGNLSKHIDRLSRLLDIYDKYKVEFQLYFFNFTEYVAYNPYWDDDYDKIIFFGL